MEPILKATSQLLLSTDLVLVQRRKCCLFDNTAYCISPGGSASAIQVLAQVYTCFIYKIQ